VLKKGGGFYKDDGPADDIPDGLDDIPDAEPRWEPLHKPATRPYVVLGKEYIPNNTVKTPTRRAASPVGTARSSTARKPRSANPTTCSR
jgi:hypothetical protein